jgi:hypothetical protein
MMSRCSMERDAKDILVFGHSSQETWCGRVAESAKGSNQ